MFRSLTLALALALSTAAVGAAQSDRSATKPPVEAAAPVNLNTATQAQLEALPGIGASTALRIIEYRQKNGGFKRVEDLMNIRGVGEKSFLRLKPLVTIGGQRASQ